MQQAAALEPWFDWAINEECVVFGECGELEPFLAAGKAVFHVEYVNDDSEVADKLRHVCEETNQPIERFSTLIKKWDLGAWVRTCPR